MIYKMLFTKKVLGLFLISLLAVSLFSQHLTSEQIALHPTDKWFTAERPDYSELDERVKTLAKNEETPEDVARIICEGLKTDIEKARAIFDWLAFNVSYDTSYSVYSGGEAFKKRKGVCQGYAELFQMLAKAADLDSIMVTGIGYGGPNVGRGGHAWNLVRLPERDLLLDACWGAGYVSGRHFSFCFAPQWFDTHPAAFAFRHYPDESKYACIYPLMSKAEFNKLYWTKAENYFPYGNSDPVEIYRNLFCKNQPNLPVTFSRHRNGYLFVKYISTGPDLPDGFFMTDYEVYLNDVKKYLSEDETAPLMQNNYDSNTVSAVSDMPLNLIAEYCNKKSEAYDFEKCYTISETEDGYEIICDYSKFGFRLPTKKEWLLACGKKYLSDEISEKDFSDAVWYDKNSGGIIKVINQTKANENGLYDMLGNVSELCFDETTGGYVFMGGNVFSSRSEIQTLEPVSFDNYTKNKGANGFRLVFNAPDNADNQYRVSQFYYNSEQFSKYSKEYREWLNLAFGNGSAGAMARYAAEYYAQGTPEGYKKAYDLCIKAAEKENDYALYILGMLYQYGFYVQKNEKESFEYFERAATAGNIPSAYKTAIFYKNGKVTEQNYDKYFYWLDKAITGGLENEIAIVDYAAAYREGLGCKKDTKKAFEIINNASKKKNASFYIFEELGNYIRDGIGNHMGIVYAKEAYETAVKKGSVYAIEQLADFAIYGKGDKRDVARVASLYKQLIDSGYTNLYYKNQYILYSTLSEFVNDFEDKCEWFLKLIPSDKVPDDYIGAVYEIYIQNMALQGSELKYSALFAGLEPDFIKSKISQSMKKLNSGEKLTGKTLIFLVPFKYQDSKAYNQKFLNEYDNVIVLQRDQNSYESIDKAFSKIIPLTGECSAVDFLYFKADLRKNNSKDKEKYLKYSDTLKKNSLNSKTFILQ